MSYFFKMPREGHFQQLIHLFAYLKINHNARIMFDPSYPEINEEDFKKHYWSDLYGDEPEPVPSNAPMPLGSEFMMRDYVDTSFHLYFGSLISKDPVKRVHLEATVYQ